MADDMRQVIDVGGDVSLLAPTTGINNCVTTRIRTNTDRWHRSQWCGIASSRERYFACGKEKCWLLTDLQVSPLALVHRGSAHKAISIRLVYPISRGHVHRRSAATARRMGVGGRSQATSVPFLLRGGRGQEGLVFGCCGPQVR